MTKAPSRDEVILKDQERKLARQLLKTDGEIAKAQITPGALAARWKDRQARKLNAAATRGKEFANQNKPALAATAVGLTLLAARKPIKTAINKFKERKSSHE